MMVFVKARVKNGEYGGDIFSINVKAEKIIYQGRASKKRTPCSRSVSCWCQSDALSFGFWNKFESIVAFSLNTS